MYEAMTIGPFFIWTRLIFLLIGIWLSTEFFLRLAQSANLSFTHLQERAWYYIGAFLLWQPLWMSGMRLRSALVGSLGTMLGARLARSDVPPAFFQWSLYITKALVLMLPFSLWMKQIRMIFIVIGVLLHVAAGILFGTWWPIILVAGLPLFLVSEISSPKAKVVQ